jgi:hypothetical protein
MTPLDKLASLPEANRQLREGRTTGKPSSRASKRISVLDAFNARCSENITVYSLA